MTTDQSSNASQDRELRDFLRGILPRVVGGEPEITTLTRTRSRNSSFYASDVLIVELAGGRSVKVFMKDFGSYRRPKEALQERRERERRVYEELLSSVDLGTPRYYGSLWDDARGRFWLFLEFVEGKTVRDLEFEYWLLGAQWLGRFHREFLSRREAISRCTALVRHDETFFHSVAEGALDSLSHISWPLHKRLVPIVRDYARVVPTLVDGEPTLVHGTYRPAQIVLDRSVNPPRVCPVDWEKAGFGSPYYDLSFLADGFEGQRFVEVLDAYRSHAEGNGIELPGNTELRYIVDCFRLHRVFNWLMLSHSRNFPMREVEKLTVMAEDLSRAVY